MESQKQDNSPAKRPTVEELISSEWVTIKQLEALVRNPELSVRERTNVANVLAFHINTLNRLLVQEGQRESLDEQTLGDFVKGIEPRIANRFRRDVVVWKRTLSLRRS